MRSSSSCRAVHQGLVWMATTWGQGVQQVMVLHSLMLKQQRAGVSLARHSRQQVLGGVVIMQLDPFEGGRHGWMPSQQGVVPQCSTQPLQVLFTHTHTHTPSPSRQLVVSPVMSAPVGPFLKVPSAQADSASDSVHQTPTRGAALHTVRWSTVRQQSLLWHCQRERAWI